jgi:aminoglycoside 3-N-acetyltransferase I
VAVAMPCAVQRLSPGDDVLVTGLLDVFAEAFEDPESYAGAQPGRDYIDRLLRSDSFIGLVAIDNGRVVAGLAAYELMKIEQQRSEIYIYDLAVLATHRRRGIATALIDRLRDIAVERGAWVIYVQADYGDEPAIALYTKLGVREDVMHFDIACDRFSNGRKIEQ